MRVNNEPFTITGRKNADISLTMTDPVSSVATLTINDGDAGLQYSATPAITIIAPPSTVEGSPLLVTDGQPVNIVFSTTNVSAQVTLKGSLDDSNYVTLDTMSAVNSLVHYEHPLKYIRADVDHWASGEMTVKVLY